MNQPHADAMMKSYAAMSDADLIRIVATQHTTLTEEARWALTETVKLRKLVNFDQQVEALRDRESSEREHARREAERFERHRRTSRTAYRSLCVVSLLAGLVLLVKGSAWSTPLLLTGIIVPLYVETRKPLRKFLLTFFARGK
ncbi:MAG: hypothetical protein RLZZ618_2907 [Pseudomonadota bacterium]|jgi:hypothetical protein